MPLGEEIPLERGHKRGEPPLKMVADRHRQLLLLIITSAADELSGGTNIDDLELDLEHQKYVLSDFLLF